MPEERVWVVTAVYRGLLDDMTVCRHENRARKALEEYKVKYGEIPGIQMVTEIIDEKEE